MNRSTLIASFAVAVFFVPFSLRLPAQVEGGAISGSVKDVSDALISSAKVAIVNTETQVTRNVEVNAQGYYSVPNLVAGVYLVSATAQGFKTVERTDVTVNVGGSVIVD